MRSIPVLLVMGAVAGALGAGTRSADAQCSVFSRHPCVNNMPSTHCSVFSRHPCAGGFQYQFGEELRFTIVSAPGTSESAPASAGDHGDQEPTLNTIHDLFDALQACWMPPPEEEAQPGMQMSVRLAFKRDGEMIAPPRVTYTSPHAPQAEKDIYHEAIRAALDRCTPLPFGPGLGGALAGRPIAIRYVDERKPQ